MKFLKTPNQNLLTLALIQRVTHVPGRGVMLLDGYGRMLEFYQQANDVISLRVRDAITEAVVDGKRATQPDWALLTSPMPDAE
jgi:hypothetical protein